MAGEGGGREGDWECSSCRNRNYAFRSFCNRCKQPRLHVDTKTTADSKWLPRIGDWICSGCTNNNYASREKCKKCGQPKEVAAMPAVADPTYFAARPDQMHPSLSLSSSRFSLDRYGSQSQPTVSVPYGVHHPASLWHLGINNNNNITGGLAFATQTNQIPPVGNGNGWRAGDWMCKCGFHNYSSRVQCKKCDAPTPIVTPQSTAVAALGTKRMASEEISNWENKRLNAGQQSYPAYDSFGVSQFNSIYPAITTGSAELPPNFQVNLQMLGPGTPVLLGKGAKQWRDGDWMCSNCNNHNYASRAQCNRCKSQRELAQPVSA